MEKCEIWWMINNAVLWIIIAWAGVLPENRCAKLRPPLEFELVAATEYWGTLTSTIRTAAALHGSTWQDPSHLATSPQLPTLKARRTWELNELFSSMLPDGGVQKIVNKIRSCGWRLQIAGSITKRVCMRWLCWLEWPWTLLHLGSNVGHNRNIE